MNFSDFSLSKLSAIIERYNLQLVESFDNYVELMSSQICVVISYNNIEKSCSFFLGKPDKSLVEVNDAILKELFYSNIRIENIRKEDFIERVCLFLEENIQKISDDTCLNSLYEYQYRKAVEYTDDLIFRQNLRSLDDAWNNLNYRTFIEHFNKINKDGLPLSYFSKYKIAIKRSNTQ